MMSSSHPSLQYSSLVWDRSLWTSSLILRVWKLEVFATPQNTQLEKLHGSDGCQDLRSHLTVLTLRQDLVHGVLLQFHLLIWIRLTPSCLANGFRRLFPWSCITLGVSFNTLSQVSDIPGISVRNTLSYCFGSFNDQSKVPDIPVSSLCALIQKLSDSFNDQDQAPDDPHFVQNPKCDPHDFIWPSFCKSQIRL